MDPRLLTQRISLLQVLVFDFGSEVFAWLEKRTGVEDLRVGVALAKELWVEPSDNSDCNINPVLPPANADLPMNCTGWRGIRILSHKKVTKHLKWHHCVLYVFHLHHTPRSRPPLPQARVHPGTCARS